MKSCIDWIIDITFWGGGILFIMVFLLVIFAKVFLAIDITPKAPPCPADDNSEQQIITPSDGGL